MSPANIIPPYLLAKIRLLSKVMPFPNSLAQKDVNIALATIMQFPCMNKAATPHLPE